MLVEILSSFGLSAGQYSFHKLNSGLINSTWKVLGEECEYILQQVNTHVFKSPGDIIRNIRSLDCFLAKHYPDYLFISPVLSTEGTYLVENPHGEVYRLMPFVKGSKTIETVNTTPEAFEAAQQFGRFTANLSLFDADELMYTLPDFHNLKLRYDQLDAAIKTAGEERLTAASSLINEALNYKGIVETYETIINKQTIPLRVIHHDTKISNVLFDADHHGLCVIDLDTVMPGYFISDLGDMMRTYLSPANEEERDLSKVMVRTNFFGAIVSGYFTEMAKVLTSAEKDLIIYSGKFMIYMQAVRFLTDFLNRDIYYTTSYPLHNLIRAKNQFKLLNEYFLAEPALAIILDQLIEAQS
ncbi:MAG TPA: aminoglycoside phosphotransferase family protein [Sphingobacteriaceae bacterium]|nr:aminoglycoside phosphotransferase family protein [Sphingobacteriaceae bacterium]